MQEVNVLNNSGINVLLVGNGKNIDYILSSRFLRKLYTTSEIQTEGVINIRFNTFRELAKKCKALQIDLVIVEEERWINEGIADVLKTHFINCIAPTAKWTQLALSNSFSRKILEKYGFNLPPTTKLPADFPLLVKGDGILRRADSMQDVIEIRQEVFERSPELASNLYMEKYLDGEKFFITSLFDGQHLLSYPCNKISETLLKKYSKKLEKMLQDEKAEFIGFINSEVILYKDALYNTGFNFRFQKSPSETDILYLLWSAIYQKLDEIELI